MIESKKNTPGFSVVERKIPIFPESISDEMIHGFMEGERVVFITIGPGETHVTVLNSEGEAAATWTAVFGWSSLCEIDVNDGDTKIVLEDKIMVSRALQGNLKIYGRKISTTSYIVSAQEHMLSAISFIMDKTIGEAKEYDRIVLAAAPWVHASLKHCLDLRPHMDKEIQVI